MEIVVESRRYKEFTGKVEGELLAIEMCCIWEMTIDYDWWMTLGGRIRNKWEVTGTWRNGTRCKVAHCNVMGNATFPVFKIRNIEMCLNKTRGKSAILHLCSAVQSYRSIELVALKEQQRRMKDVTKHAKSLEYVHSEANEISSRCSPSWAKRSNIIFRSWAIPVITTMSQEFS